MSANTEQNGRWSSMEMEKRLDKDMLDEFPLGTLSFSVDMDELAAMNNGESGIAPQVSHDDEEFRIDGGKINHHNSLISNIHMNNSAMYQNSLANKPSNGLNLARPRAERKAPVGGKWTQDEDNLLREIVQEHGPKCWKKVANLLGSTRTDVQCLHRWNKVLKPGLHKGTWTKEEDQVVLDMVMQHGVGKVKWSSIAAKLPGRIGKQCRERWFNHLDPNIKKGEWTNEEELIIFEAQRCFGNRWCEISKLLPGRTENAVKNRWNSCAMKKWLKDRGLEPGPNMNLRNGSKAEMYQAVMNFRRAIATAGVELSAEANQALSAFNEDTSEDEYSDASVATGSVRSVRSTRSDPPEVDRDQLELNMFKEEAMILLKSNSSDSVMNTVLNYDLNEQNSSYNNPQVYDGSMYRVPLTIKDENERDGVSPFQSLQPEEYHVVDALHQIKRSPYNDMISSPTVQQNGFVVNSQLPDVQQSKRLKSDGESDNSSSNNVLGSFSPHTGNEELSNQIQSLTIRQGSPLMLPPHSPGNRSGQQTPTNVPDYTALLVSSAMSKAGQTFQSEFNSSFDDLPLESISFFKYLSDDVQQALLLNLITRFQKASVNPKNFVLISNLRYSHRGANGESPSVQSTGLYSQNSSISGIAMLSNGENLNERPPLSSDRGRKRNASQAEVTMEITLSDEMAVDAAIAFVQFMINSNPTEVSVLLKSLRTNDLSELNENITSILIASRRPSYSN